MKGKIKNMPTWEQLGSFLPKNEKGGEREVLCSQITNKKVVSTPPGLRRGGVAETGRRSLCYQRGHFRKKKSSSVGALHGNRAKKKKIGC